MKSLAEGLDELRNSRSQSQKDSKPSAPLFTVMPANKWIDQAKGRSNPRKLFSELWHEGELCILFADTNLGKSILAVQIGNSISKGFSICGFILESSKQPMLYCDFELSDKQFEARYSENFTNHYKFDDYFNRAEINSDGVEGDIEERISKELEKIIEDSGAKILIIDNLTYLRTETENARNALPLMKHLKAIKKKYNLSILCLAHTPKRDLSKPITRNDLQGSKMLINFCDSSFAIGESNGDQSIRYIKQIKARNTEILYGSENVILCQINKRDSFLGFEFVGFGSERDHLRVFSGQDKETRISEAIELKQKGATNVEIASKFGVSEGAVRKWLNRAKQDDTLVPIVPLVPGTNGTSSTSELDNNTEKPPF